MGTKHHNSSDPTAESKRRRCAGFSEIDAGIEPKECIKIYLVSGKDEVDSPNSFLVEPIDLNQFFEEDGKIYGYQGLKDDGYGAATRAAMVGFQPAAIIRHPPLITVWLSSISFHAYADITFDSSSDGGKGITDLKSSLKNIFAENLVQSKDDFLQTFSTECHYVKSLVGAEVLTNDVLTDSSGNSICHLKEESGNIEILHVRGLGVGQLYIRLVPLVLLLIDGSNPIDVTDPRWEIYILIQNDQHDNCTRLLAFAAVYRFHRYPEGVRLRIGQILTVPLYQRKGCGSCLLKLLNNIAISDDVYDLTIEEPVDSLLHARRRIDVRRLLAFDPVLQALNPIVSRLKHENFSKKSEPYRCGPPASVIEDVRKNLKINERHFVHCWEILIYLSLDPIEKYMEKYMTIISNQVRADIVGKESEGAGKRLVDIPTQFDGDMSFSMFKSRNGDFSDAVEKDESEGNQEEQLKQLVEERMKEIRLVAEKVS